MPEADKMRRVVASRRRGSLGRRLIAKDTWPSHFIPTANRDRRFELRGLFEQFLNETSWSKWRTQGADQILRLGLTPLNHQTRIAPTTTTNKIVSFMRAALSATGQNPHPDNGRLSGGAPMFIGAAPWLGIKTLPFHLPTTQVSSHRGQWNFPANSFIAMRNKSLAWDFV